METHYLLKMQLLRDKVESFDRYPYSLPVIKNFESLEFHPNVTFIVGVDFPGFARHFLAWNNSFLQTSPEKFLQYGCDVLLDYKTFQ